MSLHLTELGKKSAYITQYTPDLLFPIERKIKRDEIHVLEKIPFHGYDLWNAYEISWLNQKGKPIVAIAEITVPATSTYLVESKSFKLYLNSFNQTTFQNEQAVQKCITEDLSRATQSTVAVNLITRLNDQSAQFSNLNGACLDDLDINVNQYIPDVSLLTTENTIVTETIHSHLLKSNCLVTGQPDWGSIEIQYSGNKINHKNLLKYLISFRQHNEFHEQCVERIFMDILNQCQPTELTVYARYTRRGGLDINPYRSTIAKYLFRNPR